MQLRSVNEAVRNFGREHCVHVAESKQARALGPLLTKPLETTPAALLRCIVPRSGPPWLVTIRDNNDARSTSPSAVVRSQRRPPQDMLLWVPISATIRLNPVMTARIMRNTATMLWLPVPVLR